MKNRLSAMLVLILCSVQLSSYAAGKRKQAIIDQISGNGYGLAGCGAGSVLFGPKKGMVQIIAATTNDVYSNQTFGMTSGTSNCDLPEMGMEAASYIETNKEVIKKDAARGQGETLQNLASIFNCENQAEFDLVIRQNYSDIFLKTQDSFQSTREIMKLIEAQKNLNCHNS